MHKDHSLIKIISKKQYFGKIMKYTCLRRAKLEPFSPYTEPITFSGTMISTVVFVTIADLFPLPMPKDGVKNK